MSRLLYVLGDNIKVVIGGLLIVLMLVTAVVLFLTSGLLGGGKEVTVYTSIYEQIAEDVKNYVTTEHGYDGADLTDHRLVGDYAILKTDDGKIKVVALYELEYGDKAVNRLIQLSYSEKEELEGIKLLLE